jgi:hypothetical protein
MRDIRTLDRLIDERAKVKEWRRYRGGVRGANTPLAGDGTLDRR